MDSAPIPHSFNDLPADILRIIAEYAHMPKSVLRLISNTLAEYAPDEKNDVLSIYGAYRRMLELDAHPWYYARAIKKGITLKRAFTIALRHNNIPAADLIYAQFNKTTRKTAAFTDIISADRGAMFAHFIQKVHPNARSDILALVYPQHADIIAHNYELLKMYVFSFEQKKESVPPIAALFPEFCVKCARLRLGLARTQLLRMHLFEYAAKIFVTREDIVDALEAGDIILLEYLVTRINVRNLNCAVTLRTITRETAQWALAHNIVCVFSGFVTPEIDAILCEFRIVGYYAPSSTSFAVWPRIQQTTPVRFGFASTCIPTVLITNSLKDWYTGMFSDLKTYYAEFLDVDVLFRKLVMAGFIFKARDLIMGAHKYFEFRDLRVQLDFLIKRQFYDEALELSEYMSRVAR